MREALSETTLENGFAYAGYGLERAPPPPTRLVNEWGEEVAPNVYGRPHITLATYIFRAHGRDAVRRAIGL